MTQPDLNDDKQLNEKICFNVLISEKMQRLSINEKQKIVKHLIDSCNLSEREIARRIGIPHTTLHGWKTGKIKDKTGEYVSLEIIIKKLSNFELRGHDDYLKIKEIYNLAKSILE